MTIVEENAVPSGVQVLPVTDWAVTLRRVPLPGVADDGRAARHHPDAARGAGVERLFGHG